MIEAILYSIAGLVGLAIGGELLVRGAVGIAQRLGVSNLVTGLVIVGFATSMPEMVASVEAALAGSPGIAWGNIVGSNIWNTFCVLGTAAAITPLPRGDVSVAMLGIMAAAGVVLWIFCATSRQINRLEGAALLAGYIGCQAWLFS